MQRMSVIASFQNALVVGWLGSCRTRLVGQIGSRVRVGAVFKQNARLVGRLGSGPRLVSRIGSGPCLVGRVGSDVQLMTVFTF